MAYTQAQIDELKKKMAEGVSSVTGPDGRSVTMRALWEMERQLKSMEAEVNGNERPRRTVATYNGGF